ncbi:unnamed protein product [Darwinula stevensoni]|uniref:Sulfatase N-terminal domain-containing protein n=1 Tax=Darwinula stevensoni TaxID=69355 RepID=A0A7R8XDJ6_9CRUS|nr:unnamed protein product [Darwinula stevensoni]CAG0893120.1 unnamed protein product [Darwinula stevensoni]
MQRFVVVGLNLLLCYGVIILASRKLDPRFLELVHSPVVQEHGIYTRDNMIPVERGQKDTPNIVILFADDMGWGDMGANSPTSYVHTPTLDSLAAKGIRFTDFHSGAATCSPSRASLLTGRLGLRNGVVRNFEPDSIGGLPLNETTLADVARRKGYTTGMIGKWHLGINGLYHPIHRGFETYYGLPYSNDMGCIDSYCYNSPEQTKCPTKLNQNITANGVKNITSWMNIGVPLYDDLKIIEQPVNITILSSRYAERARSFISRNAKKSFLLYVAFAHMHVPLAFQTDEGFLPYQNTLYELDETVKTIHQALINSGVEENTLIWFASDNGPWELKCEYSGSAGPFKGDWQRRAEGGGGGSASKQTVWEGGHRVPSFIYWPQVIKEGWVSAALASTLDILPTVASLIRAPLPPGRAFDGVDLTPVINGRQSNRNTVLFHPNSGAAGPEGEIGAARVGPYKGVYYSGGSPACGGNTGPSQHHDPPLLFDLESDPSESSPLSPTSPNFGKVMKVIKKELQNLHYSLKVDNKSQADYTQNPSLTPCCSVFEPACRCH